MYGSLYSFKLEVCFALGIEEGDGDVRDDGAPLLHSLSPRFNAVAFVWQLRFGKAAVIS